MITISLSEIQRNISLLSTTKEPFKIVNKRKNEEVAIVYPVEEKNNGDEVMRMAGKYSHRIPKEKKEVPLEKAIEMGTFMALKEKYNHLDE